MTSDELEAVVWRHLGPRYALRGEARRAVEAIMAAAWLYREDTPALTQQRRTVLAECIPLCDAEMGSYG